MTTSDTSLSGQGPTAPRQGDVRRRRRRRGLLERAVYQLASWSEDPAAIVAIAICAGVGALLSPAAPTGLPALDAIYRVAWAVLVTLAASRSRRWTWIVAGGVAMGASNAEAIPLVLGAASLAFAVIAAAADERTRGLGAAVGATASVALLNLPELVAHGANVVLGTIVTACICGSAYANLRKRKQRKLARRLALATTAVVVLAGIGAAVAAWLGAAAGNRALDASHAWLAAAQAGEDNDVLEAHLHTATEEFDQAQRAFNSWYAMPARLLPIVSQQLGLAATVADEGHGVARSAEDAFTRGGNYRAVALDDGRIDIAKVSALESPLQDARTSLDRAADATEDLDLSWALPQVRTQVDKFRTEVADATDTTDTAIAAVRAAPELLGADGPKRYFVAFLQPAELRGLGGFMGSWAILTADNGKVELTETGRAEDLAPPPGTDFTLDAPEDYVAAYGRWEPQNDVRDISLTPDFPTAARIYASVYEQSTGTPVDGVLSFDPYALADLMQLTGPITVEGVPQPLTAENAAQFLLHDQYILFDQSTDERVDMLETVGRQVFDKLTAADVKPTTIASILGPRVDQRRVMAWSPTPAIEDLFVRLGVDGSFVVPERGDFISVVNQNAGNNKIDYYLHREVDYRSTVDPDTGQVDATITVTLRNDAPSTGEPAYVIGDNNPYTDYPTGSNSTQLTIYTPLGSTAAELDGQPIGVSSHRELGVNGYSARFAVPSNGTATLTLHLSGQLVDPAGGVVYRYQPVVWPDDVQISVDDPSGAVARSDQPVSSDLVATRR